MWKVYDYECTKCGHYEERTVKSDEADAQKCTNENYNCGHSCVCTSCPNQCDGDMTRLMCAPLPAPINQANSDFSDRQRDRLEKRSTEHFKREGRDEAIERQRAQWKREGIVS